jgi:predicted NUDIX family NTP pyrophosphohydrolase
MYLIHQGGLEVLLVHPGGPSWAKKDLGAWSIPKGEYHEQENPLEAAIREFREETGLDASGPFLELGSVRQAGGKIVSAWAFEGDCDPTAITSNLCRMEWPPRSGRQIEFPEVDRARWFTVKDAKTYVLAQRIQHLTLHRHYRRRPMVDGACYQTKLSNHIDREVAAQPELIQIENGWRNHREHRPGAVQRGVAILHDTDCEGTEVVADRLRFAVE